jgi:hypothetical protein
MDKIQLNRESDRRAEQLLLEPWKIPVAHEDLFTPDFMKKYTEFGTYLEMLKAWGKLIPMAARRIDLSDPEWEALVQSRSRFRSWHDMTVKAVAEWLDRRIQSRGHL